jgi:hypothetical protein
MKLHSVSFTFLLLGLPFCSYADEPSIKATFGSFFEALKRGDADAAISLVYQPPGAEQRTRERVRSLARKAKGIGETPEYIDAKAEGTIAIALTKDVAKRPDGSADFDSVLLLKRDDKWSIVMVISEIEDRMGILTNEERKQLTQLRQWEEVQMCELNSRQTIPK